MSQFRLRKKPRISYYEIEEPSFDEYVFCTECCDYVFEYCSIHGPLLVIPDKVTAKTNSPTIVPRAALTIPDVFLHLARSTIPDAGLGVFTTLPLPANVRFGPYKGTIVQNVASNYCWQIYDKDYKPCHMIDASDKNESNWMRYVNCSRHCSEQNLIAFQYQGEIYYRTTRQVPRFTELMVFYGVQFAHKLKIDFRKYNKPFAPLIVNSQENEPLQIENAKVNDKIDNNTILNTNRIKEELDESEYNNNEIKLDNKKPKAKHNRVNKHENKKLKKSVSIKLENVTNGVRKELPNTEPLVKHTAMKIEELNQKNTTSKLNNTEMTNLKETKFNNKMFECDKCNFKGLQCHRVFHNEMHRLECDGLDVFKCDVCYFICLDKASLEAHRKCHEARFCCNMCNKSFTKKYGLTCHTRIHTGDKRSICNICGKRFSQKNLLTFHTRIHTGDKPYICNICDKRYTVKSNLTTHTRIHTGEKPYICYICDKKFQFKYQLMRHTKIHIPNN